MASVLNSLQKKEFDQKGFIIIRNFFDKEETSLLEQASYKDENIKKHLYDRKDSEGLITKMVAWNHPDDSIYGTVARSHKMVDTMEHLLGGEVYHYHSKITAKELGIPLVPGSKSDVVDFKNALIEAKEIGYPVLIKAASGGGGRGMKVAMSEKDLESAFTSAKSEAKAAFGDGRVYMERYLQKPRHIEVQIIGDKFGNTVHLGERECSIQRRHQKVIEEAPSPAIDQSTRDKIGKAKCHI